MRAHNLKEGETTGKSSASKQGGRTSSSKSTIKATTQSRIDNHFIIAQKIGVHDILEEMI